MHTRSRRHARSDRATITSMCRHCGKPMAKLHGRWRIVRESEAPPGESDQAERKL
jgi:hypothetical protein